MFKFSTRRNLIYITLLVLFSSVRKIVSIIISSIFNFSNSNLFTLLMFSGELFAGIISYRYQISSIKKEEKNPIKNQVIPKSETKAVQIDNNFKIYCMMFMSAFYDFTEFSVVVNYISKFSYVYGSLDTRMSGLLIIFSALMYYYVLKFPIFRHHFFSLLTIGISIIGVLIVEIIVQINNNFCYANEFIFSLFLTIVQLFFGSMLDSGDKYLLECNSTPPMKILMFQGLFGSIFSLIGFIFNNPFTKITKIFKNDPSLSIALFIFLLFLYVVLSGFINIYRLYTTKVYSPMAECLSRFCLNSLFMLYDYLMGNDFIIKGKKNFWYFFINFILSIVITFTSCIYNEFIILFCCGLEYDTYEQVSNRSKYDESENVNKTELSNLLKEEESDKEDNKKDTYIIYV